MLLIYKTFVRDTVKIMNRTCFGMTGTAVEVMFDNCFVCSHALCICFVLPDRHVLVRYFTHQSLELCLCIYEMFSAIGRLLSILYALIDVH